MSIDDYAKAGLNQTFKITIDLRSYISKSNPNVFLCPPNCDQKHFKDVFMSGASPPYYNMFRFYVYIELDDYSCDNGFPYGPNGGPEKHCDHSNGG